MRVVFMGTPDFAVPTLRALAAMHEVAGVFTRPDSGAGRGRKVLPSPVKAFATEAGLRVEQPNTLRDPAAVATLASLAPDVIVVAAYGMLLPPDVLDVAPLGCVNVHASLLPRWRGAAPIQRAILAGDAETGVSIMRMEEGLDTGPVCMTRTTDIDDKTADALTTELAELGAAALIDALESMAAGVATWVPQDTSAATYASKLTADDVALAPELTVEEALRRVRASGPSAPCRAMVAGKPLVVLEASRSSADLPQGLGTSKKRLELGLADGSITLDRIVPEGRGAMTGAAYVCGARLGDTCEWSVA